jgi:hypothetical protein
MCRRSSSPRSNRNRRHVHFQFLKNGAVSFHGSKSTFVLRLRATYGDVRQAGSPCAHALAQTGNILMHFCEPGYRLRQRFFASLQSWLQSAATTPRRTGATLTPANPR